MVHYPQDICGVNEISLQGFKVIMSLSSDQISISQRDLSLSQDMRPEVLQLKTHQTALVDGEELVLERRGEGV